MASRQPNALAGLRMMFADQDSEDEVNDEDVREKDKETHEPNKKEKQESSEENCAQEDEIPPVQVIVPGPTTPKPLKSILKKSRMQELVSLFWYFLATSWDLQDIENMDFQQLYYIPHICSVGGKKEERCEGRIFIIDFFPILKLYLISLLIYFM